MARQFRAPLALLIPAALLAQPTPPSLAKAREGVVLIRVETAPGVYQQGSGVVLAQGLVATNAHVVKNGLAIRILKNGQSWEATGVCVAADRDLVLLRVPQFPIPPVAFAPPSALRPGLPVVTLGYPGGRGPVMAAGHLDTLWKYRGDLLLQSDAAIHPGSSGGGLFTEDGLLLGITTFVFPGSQRLNFSVPVAWVQALLASPEGSLQCPAVVREELLTDSADLLAADPSNGKAWEDLARTWAQDSPGNPNAWCALGEAIEERLRQAAGGAGPSPTPADWNTVQEAFAKAVRLDPRHARAWTNLGACLDSQNRFEEARQAFQHAVQLKPSYGEAWMGLGGTLLNAGKLAEACRAFAQGLRFHPDDSQGWGRLAYCESRLKRWPEAAEHYRIALALQPFRPDWWAEAFQARTQGHLPEAATALARLRALAPQLAANMERWAAELPRHGR